MRLFYFTHGETPQDTQEFVNMIRTTAAIQRIFPYAAQRTIALRGTPDEIALAEWLFSRLDKPADPQTARTATYEFPQPSGGVEAVRVFYFTHDETPEDLQRMISLIRTTADIQRIYPYVTRRAIALRGSAAQIALAEWLFGELDKDVTPQTKRTEAYERLAAGGRSDAVRLFFFARNETPHDLQEIIQLIRTTADIQRMAPYGPRRAIALRGTPAQIALAEWLFGKLSTPPSEVQR